MVFKPPLTPARRALRLLSRNRKLGLGSWEVKSHKAGVSPLVLVRAGHLHSSYSVAGAVAQWGQMQ